MNLRNEWEEKASLFAACFVLLCCFLVQDSAHPYAEGVPHDSFTMFLLSGSAFLSARAVVRFASLFLPSVAWWLRGILRWTFWCLLRTLLMMPIVGTVCSVFQSVPVSLLLTLAAAIHALLMARQIIRDYAAARSRFGSIAQAEKMQYPDGRQRLGKGCRA